MRTRTRVTRSLALAAPVLALLAGVGEAALGQLTSGEPEPERRVTEVGGTVELRLLGVNDFHGHLESPGSRRRGEGNGPKVPVGGAAVLGSHLDKASREMPGRTIRVHAGDMVGVSPLVSSHFHDEPAVEAMNLMRFDVGTLGNHEFDEGAGEMLRLLRGGRRSEGRELKRDARGRPENTSQPGFEGARFPYIAANAVDVRGRPLLPPTAIVERAGVKVGFIGVTTDTSPDYLLPRHRAGLRFLDISQTVNRYVPRLRAQGVRAIVVLAHSGAHEARGSGDDRVRCSPDEDVGAVLARSTIGLRSSRGRSGCAPPRARGEIVDEAREMSDDVDVVVAGHTQTRLNLELPNRSGGGTKLVVEALSYGTAYDQVDLRVDRRTGEVVSSSARTPTTWSDEVEPEPELGRLVRRYSRRIAPLAKQVLGRARHPVGRPDLVPGTAARGLSAIVADAQRELAGADVAFVNPGNMRADLDGGAITYEGLFAVAPYEHEVMKMEMRGADILRLLAQQATPEPSVWLQASGMRWERRGGQIGNVVMADGRPLRLRHKYTVAANELLAGAERFSVLAERDRKMRAVGTDLEALARHVKRTKGPIDGG